MVREFLLQCRKKNLDCEIDFVGQPKLQPQQGRMQAVLR